jgi:hypothetical protein
MVGDVRRIDREKMTIFIVLLKPGFRDDSVIFCEFYPVPDAGELI